MIQSALTRGRFRTVDTLRQTLAEMNRVEEDLKRAIKDEKEAQEMYIRSASVVVNLIRMDPGFRGIYADLSQIYSDERRHEGIFASILRETQDARKRVEMELKQRQDRERYAVEMGFPGAQITGASGRKWK